MELDTPDGITVTEVDDPEDGPSLQAYTGRMMSQFTRAEVKALVDVLNAWIARTRAR
jgi:hypothetical protein